MLRIRTHVLRISATLTGLILIAMTLMMVLVGPAEAAVRSSRPYADCIMTATLDQDAGGNIYAGANVSCSQGHNLSVHTHLQYFDPNYTNPVEHNHWRNASINMWGPYYSAGMNGTLWTSPTRWAGVCASWRAETQISFTNSLPTSLQYVATPSLRICG